MLGYYLVEVFVVEDVIVTNEALAHVCGRQGGG